MADTDRQRALSPALSFSLSMEINSPFEELPVIFTRSDTKAMRPKSRKKYAYFSRVIRFALVIRRKFFFLFVRLFSTFTRVSYVSVPCDSKDASPLAPPRASVLRIKSFFFFCPDQIILLIYCEIRFSRFSVCFYYYSFRHGTRAS